MCGGCPGRIPVPVPVAASLQGPICPRVSIFLSMSVMCSLLQLPPLPPVCTSLPVLSPHPEMQPMRLGAS